MVRRVSLPSLAMRAAIVLAVVAALAGCGSSLHGSSVARASDAPGVSALGAGNGCAATVIDTLGVIAMRVYHEGVSSERTAAARCADRCTRCLCARRSKPTTHAPRAQPRGRCSRPGT